jgi:signal transduction histidine kinase
MNRLRPQLILAFTLVALVAVGTIAVLFFRTADTQFRRYITHSGMQASGSGLQRLIALYEQQGSWEGVETLLDDSVFISGPLGMPMTGASMRASRPGTRLELILADAWGRIVYDSGGEAEGRRLKSAEKTQALPISTDGDEVIGYLLLSLPDEPDRLDGLEQQFLSRMQRILVLGAALAVGVALALGALLSQSLTAPLQRLAAAARAVAAGNLSHRVRLEGSAEMVEVAHAFNDMTAALSASERQRKNMVADVAHELRSPLTVLQGNLRAILDDLYPLDKTEVSRLYDETRLLSRLVDDLRELALADAGQLRLHARPTDLAEVIRSTAESLEPVSEAEEVALCLEIPSELLLAQADPDRVAQVLRNLLINALRHTPPGGEVSVTASAVQGSIEIAVTDTGEGIAPQHLPHVFERFWQGDAARTRKDRSTGSSGLGLSVAQSLVEAQGGRIWAESRLGHGSTFRFTVPVLPSP